MSKRDNDYYARQLQRNHPQIWHDFQTGVHKTIAEARRAAGLGGERTRLHELKNAWSKATEEQRDEFLDFLDAEGVKLTKATPAAISVNAPTPVKGPATGNTGLGFVVAQNGCLTTEAKDRINYIIDQRGLRGRFGAPKIGVVMKELRPSFSVYNTALATAVSKGTRMKPELIEAVEKWLIQHAKM